MRLCLTATREVGTRGLAEPPCFAHFSSFLGAAETMNEGGRHTIVEVSSQYVHILAAVNRAVQLCRVAVPVRPC